MRNVVAAISGGISRRSVLTGAAVAAAASGVTATPALAASSRPSATADGYRTRLVLLGTAGGPGGTGVPQRLGISTAVAVADRYYLIDAGEGAAQRLRESGLGASSDPLDRMGGIFLTHLHSDHIVDVNTILNAGLYRGLDALEDKIGVWGPGNRGKLPPVFGDAPPPPVVAPDNPTPGTRELVELLVRTYATDYNDRARDNRKPVPDQLFEGHDVPIPEQYLEDPNGTPEPRMRPVTFYEDDRVRVSATLVQHEPVFPALAYRLETDDGAVVVSGDTGPSANLVELAHGADVLVHEVLDRAAMERSRPEPRSPSDEATFQHHLRAHTTIEQVGPIAEEAGVGTLVLSHFVPASNPEEAWLPAQRGFSGRLVVGRDLDQIGVGRPETS